jgi:hypothetical protein
VCVYFGFYLFGCILAYTCETWTIKKWNLWSYCFEQQAGGFLKQSGKRWFYSHWFLCDLYSDPHCHMGKQVEKPNFTWLFLPRTLALTGLSSLPLPRQMSADYGWPCLLSPRVQFLGKLKRRLREKSRWANSEAWPWGLLLDSNLLFSAALNRLLSAARQPSALPSWLYQLCVLALASWGALWHCYFRAVGTLALVTVLWQGRWFFQK